VRCLSGHPFVDDPSGRQLTRCCPLSLLSHQAGAHWFSFASSTDIQQQAQDELAFRALSGLSVTEPDCGVSAIRGHSLFETEPGPRLALPWWHTIVPRFRVWTKEELEAKTKETGVAYARAFSYESVMIHPPHYLNYLYRTFIGAGGVVQEGEVVHLADLWSSSSSSAGDVVVNCTGLGSSLLGGVSDTTVTPDRGQTIRVRAEGITDIWRAPGEHVTYVLPRGDGTVILGGTHDKRGSAPERAHAIREMHGRFALSMLN
jgi:D-amino-acid oxidase